MRSQETNTILHEPKKAAAVEEKDERKPRSLKRNGKVAWHQESLGRLHCIMRLRQDLRLESNCSKKECNIQNGTVRKR